MKRSIIQSQSARAAEKADGSGKIKLQRFDFNVQFCWQPKSPSERRALKGKGSRKQGPTSGRRRTTAGTTVRMRDKDEE